MTDYQSILEGNPPERLYWTPQMNANKATPPPTRNAPLRPFASRNEPWLTTEYAKIEFTHTQEGKTDIFRWETPHGVITGRREHNHMTEYPVKDLADIPVWRYIRENTSASLISPDVYREHSLPHVRDYADLAHRHGKRFIVHMCGLLNALLDCFPETGMDGIHAVTPPPIGDTHFTTVRERYGEKFVIVGRLNGQLWINKTQDEMLKTLQEMIPVSLIRTPFALWITSDEMPVSEQDIANLNQALEEYNKTYAIMDN